MNSVSTDIENRAAWKECFSVSGVKLPTGYYFGVSGTTGDLSDNHDVISIRLYELDLPEDVSIQLGCKIVGISLKVNSLGEYRR